MVSLSGDGCLTWWSIVQVTSERADIETPSVSSNLGAAPWSRIELTKGASFSVAQHLYK